MIALIIVTTIVGATINIYRHINKHILFKRFNNATSNIAFSFAGH